MPDHLTATSSHRGLDRLPPTPGAYGGSATVYESSAAMSPHLWMKVEVPADHGVTNDPDVPVTTAIIHLTTDNAWRLADQLRYLVQHHYHGDSTPEWARE